MVDEGRGHGHRNCVDLSNLLIEADPKVEDVLVDGKELDVFLED